MIEVKPYETLTHREAGFLLNQVRVKEEMQQLGFIKSTANFYSPYFFYSQVLDIESICMIVCEHAKISVEQIKSRLQYREFVDARKFFCKFCRMYTKSSLVQIAEYINRDHATVLYLARACDNLVYSEPKITKQFHKINKVLNEMLEQKYSNYEKSK